MRSRRGGEGRGGAGSLRRRPAAPGPRRLSLAEAQFYARVFDPARRGSLAELRRRGCDEHDAAIAESLTEELAPVGDWPASVARIRCERNEKNVSVCRPEQHEDSPRDLGSDLKHLGLMGEMQTPA